MRTTAPEASEHLDVLIVGAGISGIGAAYYLQRDHAAKSYAIVEARAALGGTWDLFRYPGIRSDSDLYTFGYEFKPWTDDKAIAGGDAIVAYLRETAAEFGIDRHIRYHHRLLSAAWSSRHARWTVELERCDTHARSSLTCSWLFCAGGYYRYDQGYCPRFEGSERFQGVVVHPQHWPAALDCSGKRVVVIGSGATAVTLVPALARSAAHVTMLQRTPTYVLPVPSADRIATRLRKLLPAKWAHALARRKGIALQRAIYRFSQRYPAAARRLIRSINIKRLPAGYPVDQHFNPPYDPWTQRLCVVPDGDLFRSLRDGRASVVTDAIERFDERGIVLTSGQRLDADVIVTATGLNLQVLGGIALSVDGEPVNLKEKVVFRGMMLSGVPNLAFALGYTSSSWTLKIGLLCEHFCRLLRHMDRHAVEICTPLVLDAAMETRPLLDFGAGYVQRAIDSLPRQGRQAPWLMSMDYHSDAAQLRHAPVEHPELRFSVRVAAAASQARPALDGVAAPVAPTGAA